MDFRYTEEQLALQDSLRRYLDKHYTLEQRRTLMTSQDGFSRAAWAAYAELGLLALPFAEEVGGLGGQPLDTSLVVQTLSRALALEPYLPTVVLCGSLLRSAGSPAQQDALIGAIAQGELQMALAHQEPGVRYALQAVQTQARREGTGWRLDGRKALVLGGTSADKLLVSARSAGEPRDGHGISLFLVEREAAGLRATPRALLDGSRAVDLQLDGVHLPADSLVGPEGGAMLHLELAMDHGVAALCAEAVGIMLALNEATLEYLKTRKQFGVAIGSFQALQHRMAEMMVAAEQARSMSELAALKLAGDDPAERARTASAAKAYVGNAARFVGQQAVQLHGGMGVVDELIVSHYFKRLTLINASLGDVDHHVARFGALMAA